ncbi:MAG: ECF transporter S component [Lachnospiraceae bacterium]|nr:ECF transporter S component [Lachnospiraceae bacterium]
MNNELWKSISENVLFLVQFFGIVIAMFIIAYAAEKIIKKRNNDTERVFATRKVVVIGMFSALAAILHIFKFSVPFIAPAFYEMDLSEVPVIIGAFAFGPVAGVMIEFCKILLKLLLTGTSTAFVGDLANFVIGCSYVLPASIIYAFRKSRKRAIIGCVVGTASIGVFGMAFNALYLIPTFAKMFFGNNIDVIIGMGNAVHSVIDSVWTLALFAVLPFNLLKGLIVSVITLLVYKKLSPLLKKQ